VKVRELMTEQPQCCSPDTNLAVAAQLMWTNDCGVLPVAEDGKLTGVITDRDICIALGTRDQTAAQTAVKDVATREVQTCRMNDDVATAMATMRRAGVHRLPVVGDEGKLEGILALNDLVLAADHKRKGVADDDVMATIKSLSQHRDGKTAEAERLKFPAIQVAVA